MNIPDFLNKDDPLIASMVKSVESYASLYRDEKITYEEYMSLCSQETAVSNLVGKCASEMRLRELETACRLLLTFASAFK